jgi:hypothetical protein
MFPPPFLSVPLRERDANDTPVDDMADTAERQALTRSFGPRVTQTKEEIQTHTKNTSTLIQTLHITKV